MRWQRFARSSAKNLGFDAVKKTVFITFLSLLFGVLIGGGVWVAKGLSALEDPAFTGEPMLFTVEQGSSFQQVGQRLEELGLVEDALWLRLHARLKGDSIILRSGTYEILAGMSVLDVIDMIAQGRTKSWPIQFIEGWTFADVRNALDEHENLKRELPGLTDNEVMAVLERPELHPEGMFFPDTYRYEAGESDLVVLRRALERLELVLAEEWAQRTDGLPYDNSYDALIMASLVEKETGVPHERPEIAGVFVRRLQKGMRLQTDPTVIYGLGDRYTGNLTRKHLREDGEYNTYRRSGLPPTPIALAGRAAIHAALHPASGETLYFVAKGDGSHVFSRTLAEHQKAVQHFQVQKRRGDYRSSPAPVSAP